MQKIIMFIKSEAVLCIAFVAVLVSAFFVPPDSGYIEYIDFHVLILLFCLMLAVAGIQKCGVFTSLAKALCLGDKSVRSVILALVLIPFFTSMLITNDVALITFVPFAILVLSAADEKKYLVFTIVMQTVAANLGSILTPVGNPQNLYIYSRFFSSLSEFLKIVLPIGGVSLVLICICIAFLPRKKISVPENNAEKVSVKSVLPWIIVFGLCLLSVFKILNDFILLAIVLASAFLIDKKLIAKVDFSLLLTFVFFFIFAGNIARIDSVRVFIENQMANNTKLCTLILCQFISNVPAAVMLSNFTHNGVALLKYTNIGGLGTIIASLASLISFKFYIKTERASAAKYLLVFTVFNIAFLLLLVIIF